MEITKKEIIIDPSQLTQLLGFNDEYLSMIERKFHSQIYVRGNTVKIKGTLDETQIIEKVIKELLYLITKNGQLTKEDVISVLGLFEHSEANIPQNEDVKLQSNTVLHAAKETIRARTPNQIRYLQSVYKNDIVFAIGPAGTGKTFLAVAMAIAALKRNDVSKIVLSRPAVEAGESLGFLPGDLQEKIDPYLKPLTDALQQMLTPEKYKSLLEKGIIEITPLAYMRGRTLNYSFIILDEAQNATATQMKMFLTRLGANSKALVTGDITQIDLQKPKKSGLIDANKVLQNILGIDFVYFDEKDVVRHRLVADIIKAYERSYEEKEKNEN
jgi:phosphate starvation-inducible PhoH-like protein